MLYVLSGIVINIFTSVVLIPVNKYIYTKIGFPNMTLTCLHFIVTFLGLLVCNLFKIVTIKRVSVLKMLPMAFTFCGFVVLTNISLQYNTIGTYQCLKALTTPGVMVISFYYYKTSYSARVIISVVMKRFAMLIFYKSDFFLKIFLFNQNQVTCFVGHLRQLNV